jgi:hypothetical protein
MELNKNALEKLEMSVTLWNVFSLMWVAYDIGAGRSGRDSQQAGYRAVLSVLRMVISFLAVGILYTARRIAAHDEAETQP